MPLRKSELSSSLWASCDKLRGGMDASQYKDYILVLLFIFLPHWQHLRDELNHAPLGYAAWEY